MAVAGHEDQFPLCRLNAHCVFREETFAEERANGRGAPIPVLRGTAIEPLPADYG